ncbi:MAG: Ig-like domain-containing protein [Eubacteriales bacterium]|nr:Ig-like domain-containing protein [Eubacteriales bacterium]
MRKFKNMAGIALMFVLICMLTTGVSAARINQTKLTLNVGDIYEFKMLDTLEAAQWRSSSYVKASIDTQGRLVARKKGTVTITARIDGEEYTCKVKIKQPVADIVLNKTEHTLQPGKKVKLKASVVPSNANNKNIIWKSSNTSIATVNTKGKVKAKKNGVVTITAVAKDGSRSSASCTITVASGTVPPVQTTTVTAAPGQASARALQYLAILQSYSNQVVTDQARGITWKYNSSYENHSTFAAEQKKALTKNTPAYSNCAQLVRWGLRDLGLLNGKQVFWSVWSGGKAYFNFNAAIKNDWTNFTNNFEIITVDKTPAQLEAEGNLLPGDICGWNGVQHTNVYAGNGLWYEGGRLSNVVNGIYTGFGPVKSLGMTPSGGKTIHQILRIK